MRIEVPEKVEFIIYQLREHGYEAYAVGGCVRDSILGRVPGDWDITTSASPYEVKEIFHRTIDTGIAHGTVTVMLDKEGFEVTTYRVDGEYEDCRHPKNVEFTKSLEEDLKRRDFTINAMAFNQEDGMVDLFEGMQDIEKKCIRCVGNAADRFEEDALRMLRAIRFSAQLNFTIEETTKQAIIQKAKNLVNISAERIREELNKLFLSSYPEKLWTAYETTITSIVLKEFDQKVNEVSNECEPPITQAQLVLKALKEISTVSKSEVTMFDQKSKEKVRRELTPKERLCLAYASLLWNPRKDSIEESNRAKKVMQRLKFDNDTIAMVTKLVKYSHAKVEADSVSIRRAMNEMGTDMMDVWFLFQRINYSCMQSDYSESRQKHLEQCYQIYCDVMLSKQCVCLKELALNGKDLIELGCEPGVTLGELLNELLQYVLIHPEENQKEILLEIVRKKKSL